MTKVYTIWGYTVAQQVSSVTSSSRTATGYDASLTASRPRRTGYTGYLLGDGIPPNGVDFGHGITFPNNPADGDFFLRTDMLPNRLFRYDGARWIRKEDAVRTTMTNTDTRNTQKTGFINNSTKTGTNLITSDLVTITTQTTSYLTTQTYVAGMYATATSNSAIIPTVTVTSGAGGKAQLNFSEIVNAGEQVEWKLYTSSVAERQSLSKALRPKADL